MQPLVKFQLVGSNFPTLFINEFFVKIMDYMVPGIKPNYWVSNYGRVYSEATNSFLVTRPNEKGYLTVSLMLYNNGRVFRKVHRLVLMAFHYIIGCEFLHVNHKDGNHQNNMLYNLEWCTPIENTRHAMLMGLKPSMAGENNLCAKITEVTARKIGELLMQNTYTYSQIQYMLNVPSVSIIEQIARGLTWTHLFSEEEKKALKRCVRGNYINIEEKHAICKFYEDHKSNYKYIMDLAKAALLSINLELSDRNIRIARRLYYRYDNPEIGNLYNY